MPKSDKTPPKRLDPGTKRTKPLPDQNNAPNASVGAENNDLPSKYRPTTLNGVVGQDETVKVISRLVKKNKVPHAILLTGPSGTGKTTIGRIIASLLDCHPMFGVIEINAAESRGIDTVRQINSNMWNRAMAGTNKLYLIDEAHELTKKAGGNAQTALLKMIEDAPKFTYFILATTHPQGLIKTIQTRCMRFDLKPVNASAMTELVNRVCLAEDILLGKGVLEKLIDVSNGCAREALHTLQKIGTTTNQEQQLNLIQAISTETAAFDLIKTMIPFKGAADWKQVAAVLKGLKDEDPEGLRRMILQTCASHILSENYMAKKAYEIGRIFELDLFASGFPGLVMGCFQAVKGK